MSFHDGDTRAGYVSPTQVTRLRPGHQAGQAEHSQLQNKTDQLFTLTDGRRLGYSEYGTSDGTPVFYFHGFPGSRISWPAFDHDDIATKMNVRIIAVDRPGYGISDAVKHGRTLLEWPDDVIELADSLSLDKFAVLGISGGGPYALSCAFKIPERLTKTVVVSGMGPATAPGSKEGASWLFPAMPGIVRWPMLMLMGMVVRNWPESVASQMKDPLSSPDQELLEAHPELATMIVADWQEAFRSGIGGTHQEATLFSRAWGFRVQDITSRVYLWHGDQDKNVSASAAHFLADSIPNCHVTFSENDGHLSIVYKHLEDILRVIV
mmetsp:Transcript_16345/g.27177  ORF Transcript_16345/g.27177 Transcript_16345/m.27177 type:complete len:322 (-) Transcript_16345:83-1048(-)